MQTGTELISTGIDCPETYLCGPYREFITFTWNFTGYKAMLDKFSIAIVGIGWIRQNNVFTASKLQILKDTGHFRCSDVIYGISVEPVLCIAFTIRI